MFTILKRKKVTKLNNRNQIFGHKWITRNQGIWVSVCLNWYISECVPQCETTYSFVAAKPICSFNLSNNSSKMSSQDWSISMFIRDVVLNQSIVKRLRDPLVIVLLSLRQHYQGSEAAAAHSALFTETICARDDHMTEAVVRASSFTCLILFSRQCSYLYKQSFTNKELELNFIVNIILECFRIDHP